MENYEINILKRNGDWEKIKPNAQEKKEKQKDINFISNPKSLKDINEDLENEKNNLKNSLKNYENFFLESKTNSEKKLSQVSKELEMFDKAIEIIKDLKKF